MFSKETLKNILKNEIGISYRDEKDLDRLTNLWYNYYIDWNTEDELDELTVTNMLDEYYNGDGSDSEMILSPEDFIDYEYYGNENDVTEEMYYDMVRAIKDPNYDNVPYYGYQLLSVDDFDDPYYIMVG